MAFLRNDAINRVNLHYGVQALAQGAGGVFYLVFLLRAGLSIPVTLLAMATILAGRLLLRPTLVPLAKRWGIKPVLIAGTIGMAVQYPLLARVHGLDGALAALIVVSAVGDVLYWPSFNAYFATVGDVEHRGHQIAPLLGAAALVTVGPGATFAAVGVVQALAAVPLFGAPAVAVKAQAPGAFAASKPVALFYATDGWFDACWIYVWQMALFVTLKTNIAAYGGAMALAGLVGAGCGLLIGRRIDAGRGRGAVLIAYGLGVGVVILRAASLGAPWLAVSANAVGALLIPVLSPTIGGATYNLAKASPCALRFQVGSEAGWDVGCLLACLTAAAVLSLGAPLGWAILLALPSVVAGGALIWRMYKSAGA
jgi:DHA1 family inner membrane transport protein